MRREDGTWTQAAVWTAAGLATDAPGPVDALKRAAAQLAELALANTELAQEMRVDGFRGGGSLLGFRLPMLIDGAPAIVFLWSPERLGKLQQERLLPALREATALPATYLAQRQMRKAGETVTRFGAALDLLATLETQKRFVAAAMALCNELAARYGCDRVSLGWCKGDYVRLKAVSHAENFEKKMEAVRRVETAMEECLDQDEEVVLPAADTSQSTITREHEALAREQGAGAIASLPLRDGQNAVGVLLCERATPFDEGTLLHLRLVADRTAPLLARRHASDRWFGARWATSLHTLLGALLGVRHTGAKLFALTGSIVLALFLWLPVPFRIQAPFLLRAETSTFLPAPFDGYLASVEAEPGDRVAKGAILLRLDTRELLLEEAAAMADHLRYERERDKARAGQALAAMQIAAASAEQARVRLERIRYRLSQADVTAPFEGILVEGDLRERLGAPVRQGDSLMRVACLDTLYLELKIDQRDLHEVHINAAAHAAFASRPADRVAATVKRIAPAADTHERKNIFLAECRLDVGNQADWMRPGMTGLCKIDAGKRPLAWIVARRTVDFIRLHLWW